MKNNQSEETSFIIFKDNNYSFHMFLSRTSETLFITIKEMKKKVLSYEGTFTLNYLINLNKKFKGFDNIQEVLEELKMLAEDKKVEITLEKSAIILSFLYTKKSTLQIPVPLEEGKAKNEKEKFELLLAKVNKEKMHYKEEIQKIENELEKENKEKMRIIQELNDLKKKERELKNKIIELQEKNIAEKNDIKEFSKIIYSFEEKQNLILEKVNLIKNKNEEAISKTACELKKFTEDIKNSKIGEPYIHGTKYEVKNFQEMKNILRSQPFLLSPFKTLIIGDEKTGKTQLINGILGKPFEKKYKASVGKIIFKI